MAPPRLSQRDWADQRREQLDSAERQATYFIYVLMAAPILIFLRANWKFIVDSIISSSGSGHPHDFGEF